MLDAMCYHVIGFRHVEIKKECWKVQHELLLWVLSICPQEDADSYHEAQGKS